MSDDALYEKAVEHVRLVEKASVSNIQREFKIGYNRAARIIESMQDDGIISEPNDSGKRTILKKIPITKRSETMENTTEETPEAIEQRVRFLAEEHIGADLLSAMVDEIKELPDSWQKMNNSKQSDVIFRLRSRIEMSVSEVVRIIASKDRPSIQAHVKTVKFGDNGVEGQLVLSKKNPGAHDLADSQGESVLIVVTNPSEYTQTMDEVKPVNDQGEIF